MRRTLAFVVKFAVSAGLLYLAFARVDLQSIAGRLQQANALWLTTLVLLLAAQNFLLALRWQKIGEQCGANTFPYIQVNNMSAKVEHEATTSKIGEDQLFYFAQRGVGAEEAVSMIINGFCKDVFQQLPMEFAVEATKLLGLKLEGSVG